MAHGTWTMTDLSDVGIRHLEISPLFIYARFASNTMSPPPPKWTYGRCNDFEIQIKKGNISFPCKKMQLRSAVALICATVSLFVIAGAEDPYRFFNWNVTYGDIFPLGVRQTGILINGQFPGPDIHSVTNDNLIINVFNSLNEPFLLSW
ncbi:hypothetical protein GOBAR_AA35683 [Gossypium barbadense]|uniref:Plastocyanin-like domain-containing protein n=1 Tax=Gossypium barbadense TaxID=3634 RepID=A0A2P5W1S6_GOSBA|nr:hypothetical protein GOBAR_AA35683 [Gossypium barbadense]